MQSLPTMAEDRRPDALPTRGRQGRSRSLLLLLVAGNVTLQLTAVRLIKDASLLPPSRFIAIGMLAAVIMVLAFGRFLLWGAMHQRYPLSLSYPVNALIFPLIVLMAWGYGEPVSSDQAIGAILVSAGVFLALLAAPADEPLGP
jgi:drug/metabolite transporter (DMT)-like permease